jgi:glycosyltransferase involved in cell wall biosynthesis
MKLSSLSILIPAYRDEDSIAQVVSDADAAGKRNADTYEIIVINDASPDKTGQVLSDLRKKYINLKVLTHKVNAGYGGTIRDLYYAAKMEWQFTAPGDNQIPVAEVAKLIPYTTHADMIIGWRTNRHDPPARLRQSHTYNRLLRMLFGLKLHDVNSVRLMKSRMLDRIRLTSQSAFVDAELAIRAIRANFAVAEVPIVHAARKDETSAGGGMLKTILPTIFDMIRFRF